MQLPEASDRFFPLALLWAFVPVYFVHLLDERFWGIGTANWASAHGPLYFTNTAWLWVNVPSMLALSLVVLLVAREAIPDWAVVALAVHLFLHAIMRVVGSLVFSSLSPGLVSGVLLCLPLGGWALVLGVLRLPPRSLRLGVIAGVLSFQPLWHALVFPFLPPPPPAA